MNNIKSFTFLKSYAEAMQELTEKEQKEFLLAIVKYVFYDIVPEFKGKMKLAWILVEPILTKSKNKSNTNQN
ncbi:MAG: DUF6291 domain-containing protein [Ruminococcus sp.]|nr:DUF6291 domain-containing protein [Ruminococcus sp.]